MDNVGLVIRGINRLGPKIQGIADIVDWRPRKAVYSTTCVLPSSAASLPPT
jgi:hypothetical protein